MIRSRIMTKVQTPQGPVQSFTWVIRKQYRDEPYSENVKPLAYYYIVNNVIFQAPDVSKVLECKLLNVTTALDRLLSKVSSLPSFSTSHGNTWTKPVQKSLSASATSQAQQSRAGTPMAVDSVTGDKTTARGHQAGDDIDEESRTLAQALRMTMQYGQEYSDETRLEGEPGNFRFTKHKEAIAVDRPSQQESSQYSRFSCGHPSTFQVGFHSFEGQASVAYRFSKMSCYRSLRIHDILRRYKHSARTDSSAEAPLQWPRMVGKHQLRDVATGRT